MEHIVFTVTNDLNYDQRMIRICGSLAKNGYSVSLIGRKNRNSLPLQPQPYQQKRLNVFFQKSIFFYIEYNTRLFFYLLFAQPKVFCCIDLDTMLPVYLAGRIRKKKLLYDAHEYFSQQKEIVSRPHIYKVWYWIEKNFVPRFKQGYTATASITEVFAQKYNVHYTTIRNLPFASSSVINPMKREKIILYQGAINEARGFERLIPAMKKVNAVLHIYGDGNFVPQLKALISSHKVENKVKVFEKQLPQNLKAITEQAYIGVNLVEPIGLNQYYSLANKFFDYIQALLPQLTMDYPEYKKINTHYPVAVLIEDIAEDKIVNELNRLLMDVQLYNELQQNCIKARADLCWEKEEKILLSFYKPILG